MYDRYIAEGCEAIEDPVQYWCLENHKDTPLGRAALKVLSIPATSAPAERVFSCGGRVDTPLRSRMGGKHFETIVFLKANENILDEV